MANLQKWVAALRGDGYKQGKGRLRSGTCYCVWGVACDLYAKETGKVWWAGDSLRDEKGYGNAVLPPESVRNWLRKQGIDRGAVEHLAQLNDMGMDFRYLATTIENMFPGATA